MKERIIDTIVAVLTLLAGVISFLGISKESRTTLVCWSFGVFCGLVILLIYLVWYFFRKTLPKYYSKEEICIYLERIYRRSGKCYIFSQGSLTWYEYGNIKNSLRKKSKERQLTLVLPSKNSVSNDLENIGATVYTYEELHTKNFSSWSMINPTGGDALIALGYNDKKGKHFIKEYQTQDKDFMGLSCMFADILDLLSTRKRNQKYGSASRNSKRTHN